MKPDVLEVIGKRETKCTKCCWCGYDYGSVEHKDKSINYHACTGEEGGACMKMDCPDNERVIIKDFLEETIREVL